MSLVSAYGHSQLRPLADLSPPLIPQPLLPEPVQLISTQGPEPFIEKVSSVIFRIRQATTTHSSTSRNSPTRLAFGRLYNPLNLSIVRDSFSSWWC